MRALLTLFALVSLPALAGPLNDTGIDFCRDHATGADTPVTSTTTCTAAQGGQDARYGRDPAARRPEQNRRRQQRLRFQQDRQRRHAGGGRHRARPQPRRLGVYL